MRFVANESGTSAVIGKESLVCEELHTAIWKFARLLKYANLGLLKQGVNVPGRDILAPVADEFRELIRAFARCEPLLVPAETESVKRMIQSLLGPWFWRSECWNKSRFKPYGYAGDFRIIETMYGLEAAAGRDPTRSGMENLLETLCAGLQSTRALWERRKWLKAILMEEFRRKRGKLRILDIAAGGARYIRDFLDEIPMPDRLEIWLYDQDPAAAAYCGMTMPSLSNTSIRTVTKPIQKISAGEFPGRFDVVISAGLFDYLEAGSAARLLEKLHAVKAPDGVLAITNYHTEDATRLVLGWIMDWPLIYRTPAEVAALFPPEAEAVTTLSPERALVLARSRPRL